MKVLIVEPGQYPREAEIEKSLAAEQAIVGGLIECVTPGRITLVSSAMMKASCKIFPSPNTGEL